MQVFMGNRYNEAMIQFNSSKSLNFYRQKGFFYFIITIDWLALWKKSVMHNHNHVNIYAPALKCYICIAWENGDFFLGGGGAFVFVIR